MTSLKGRTILITGASRGIGAAIAERIARDGANIAILAKSDQTHASLDGTIHTTAEAVRAAGGQALPIACDIRDEDSVAKAVALTAATFGGIDVVINNASAIHMAATADTPAKRYDLMMGVNTRGTFVVTQACLPHLAKSSAGKILTMSPPLNVTTKHLAISPAYTLSKMGMSLLTMGFAGEFKPMNIAANTLWPQTMIATDAIRVNFPPLYALCRKAEIVADAAYVTLTIAGHPTGQHFVDEAVLRQSGIHDFSRYALTPGQIPADDIFLD